MVFKTTSLENANAGVVLELDGLKSILSVYKYSSTKLNADTSASGISIIRLLLLLVVTEGSLLVFSDLAEIIFSFNHWHLAAMMEQCAKTLKLK